jgi:spore coat polysaccharide biosynthesis predicted glycosyltransferase SpsG
VLAGPDYALIRPAFAEARAKRPPEVKPEIERIFVSFGLSDVGGITARAVNLLLALAPGTPIDVAMPASSESLARLAPAIPRSPGLTLHLDALDVADLLLEADVAVGAGGASTWERCCVGVPSVAVAVADNQRDLVARLTERGVLLGLSYNPLTPAKAGAQVFSDPPALDDKKPGSRPSPGRAEEKGASFEEALGAAFLKLRSADLRARLAAASRGACDGLGANRVAEAILAQLESTRSAAGS